MRLSRPKCTADAQAELTSISASRLGVPDLKQVCQIAQDTGLLSKGKAAMLHDACQCLYLSTTHSESKKSNRVIKEAKRFEEWDGTVDSKREFYNSLKAMAENRHTSRQVRTEQLQQVQASSQRDGTADQARRVQDSMLARRGQRQRAEDSIGEGEMVSVCVCVCVFVCVCVCV